MTKLEKPTWQRILEDFPLGPEPVQKADSLKHAEWIKLRDAKLMALAIREGKTGLNGVDLRGLALALALKHEPGFKSMRKRGRPQELRSVAARTARKALLTYVTEEEGSKAIAAQSTAILKRLSENKVRLGKINPYYEDAKHQSFSKLKKDYQRARQEEAKYRRLLADALLNWSPPSLTPGSTSGVLWRPASPAGGGSEDTK